MREMKEISPKLASSQFDEELAILNFSYETRGVNPKLASSHIDEELVSSSLFLF